nr:hypothetical protein CFP56_64626 [Quercus suber]
MFADVLTPCPLSSCSTMHYGRSPSLTSLERAAAERAGLIILAALDLVQFALGEIVEDAVDGEAAVTHGVDDDGDALDDVDAGLDVELGHAVAFGGLVELVELGGVLFAQGAHGLQPDVEDVELAVGQGGGDAAARRVPAHDDVLDLEVEDGELHDAEQREVGRVHDVGDVPVREDIARFQPQHGGLGHARVGAAEPEDGGRLAFGGGREEVGLSGAEVGGPFRIAGETGAEVVGRLLVWWKADELVRGGTN